MGSIKYKGVFGDIFLISHKIIDCMYLLKAPQ